MSSPLANPAVTNLLFSLGAMQLAKRLPLQDEEFIFKLRIGYISAQVLSVAIYFFIMQKIKKRNDLTTLKYVQPASPMSQEQGGLVTTTVKDYDLSETGKAMRGLFMGVAFMCFLHLYMGYTQPLFIQAIMTLKGVLESKPAMLHLWGKKAEGDLSRPFKTGGGLLESLTGQQGGVQTDAASIKEAEKPTTKKDL
ncbi:hypothetical protein NliqN6_2157 [Naganishia liquefaciens]|uniref:Inorganic phosphate transporter Pho88 n=1 Tax=Naganishia liquefaciens TaxID=104408 RepID=A0A8H3TSD1_9TREE|nr:hypothetical protein NliqN6_2157 [Naganishia liquefaciens]